MTSVKQYTFTLFCCSLAAALVEFTAPKGCKKQISYITGMTILIIVLSPLTTLMDDLSFESNDTEYTSYEVITTDDILADQFKYNLKKIIEDKLALSGIFAEDIRIEIIMSDNEIKLGDIEVILKKGYRDKVGYIRQTLEEHLELNISVKIQGGDSDGG